MVSLLSIPIMDQDLQQTVVEMVFRVCMLHTRSQQHFERTWHVCKYAMLHSCFQEACHSKMFTVYR